MNSLLLWKNPILRRELLDRLRSLRAFASILAVAIGAALLVILRWPSESTLDIVSQGAMQVFRPLAFGLAVAVMMLVPAFPATAIVRERRRGTLALLLNSPLRPTDIYFGKLLSNVFLAFVLISVSLPSLGACYAMGGLSLQSHMLPLLTILVCMALQYSAVSLWISVQAGSSDSSLRWSYAAVLILAFLSLAPSSIYGNLPGWQSAIAQKLTAISPMPALQEITGSQSATTEFATSGGWKSYVIGATITTLLFAIATIVKLDPLLLDRPRPTGKIVKNKNTVGGWARRMVYLIDPEKQKVGIPLFINPVMVKEFRTRKFGRLHWLLRLIATCGVISLFLTVITATGTVSWGVDRIAATLVLMQIALLIVLGPSLASGLIAGEVESGGWQLLRMTSMSTLRIVNGKLMSVAWTMLLILLATVPGYAVMMWIQPATIGQVQRVLISLGIATMMIVLVSACISAFCRSAAVATATSYGVLLAMFAGTFLVWLARGKPFGPIFVERVLSLNPTAAALAEIRVPGFESLNLTPISWWIGLCVSALCLLLLSIRTWHLARPD